jgi:lipopolysaccharide transport system permease protein
MTLNAWNYRHLIKKIAISDLKLRYKNSILGFFWSLLEPLLMLIVLYVVFSYLMRIEVEHYQLFLLLGIISWELLDKGTTFSMNSIIGKPSLVKKVYFPREILVISACVTALLMVLLELVVFAAFMIAFRVFPTPSIIAFPIIFFAQFLLVIGLSLGLASLNVYYRDVQYIWAVILRAGFFATPILYPVTFYPEKYFDIFMLNPMARIIDTLRNSIIYHAFPSAIDTFFIVASAVIILVIGYLIFIKLEPRFAEEV